MLNSGQSVASVARALSLPKDQLYRHTRSGHHEGTVAPSGLTIASSPGSSLVPSISATLRDVQRLAREAQRHLKAARLGSDHKATNGAITAAAKALELVGKLRGELQHGANVNVNIGVEAKVAMDLRSQADALHADDVTEQAKSWLAAQIEAGDRYAIAAVLALVRMVPGADATVPDGTVV